MSRQEWQTKHTADDLFHFAGHANNIDEVIENWKTERQTMRELKDERTALIIYNRRIRLVITLCLKAFDILDTEGGLFVPQIVKDVIKQAREQVMLLDNSLASSLEICESPTVVTADAKNAAPLNL